jgi:hypothetical protein
MFSCQWNGKCEIVAVDKVNVATKKGRKLQKVRINSFARLLGQTKLMIEDQ